ncbi:response regulator [Sulfitobacter sp. HNIBRBA3233]|uniref:response regulator n=1 Tax=Sulfitobacter marinivivus TaxID=3158558 RepID=UPI0032DF0371
MRILAVDDDPTILEITELFLESIGYTDVSLAPSAQHAMKEMDASDRPFDCILLDINMPGMTGIDLIPHIIDHPHHHEARIVMLTALSDTQHIADAFVAGAIDYMLKPFELFDLEASIKAVEAQRMAERPIPVTALDYKQSQVVKINTLIERGATLRSDASGVVSPFAIENCVLRVPGSTRDGAAVALVELATLAGGRKINGIGTEDPYILKLTEALVEAIKDTKGMLSYNGEGVFTILAFNFSRDEAAPLLDAVHRAVETADKEVFADADTMTAYRTLMVHCRDLPDAQNPLITLRDARAGDPVAAAVVDIASKGG